MGTFHQVYDTAGRLTSVTDPNNRTVTYQYDAGSNRTRLEYPDGSYALYAYDELGRMTTVQYDPNDSATAPSPTTVAAYTYDNLNRRTVATLGNGTRAAQSYSTDGLLAGITHTNPAGNVTFTYGHDSAGLINSLTVSDNMFAPYTDIGGYKGFTPNNLNQYTSAMGKLITHDLNGNLAGDGNNFYVHDAINRLNSATVDATSWTYTYGPIDRRVAKTDGTTTTKYLYDNARAVAEYSSSGTLLRKYIYGPGLDELIMMVVPGDDTETVYYYHADHLGSIIGLTNDAGAWAEKYAYTMYGKPAAPSTIGNPYMYTGRRFDPETGLYYYRARYYDSHLRRFIQPDPIGYIAGPNLYAYVLNNPVNWIDSDGLQNTLPAPAPVPIVLPKTDVQIKTDQQMANHIYRWMVDHYNPDNWVVRGWNWLMCEEGEEEDEEKERCRKVKNECIELCSDTTLPTNDYGFSFFRCLNRCMETNDCL